jgi:hypothetical protein
LAILTKELKLKENLIRAHGSPPFEPEEAGLSLNNGPRAAETQTDPESETETEPVPCPRCRGQDPVEDQERVRRDLTNLRHAHSQLKKVLQDKCNDLALALRRGEHAENDCKRMRLKVEGLKKELVLAEEETTGAMSTLRKLQQKNNALQQEREASDSIPNNDLNTRDEQKWYPKVADV